MTARQRTTLVCSRCKATFSEELWASVNVTLDPEMKARLLAGEVNVVSCPKCQATSYVPVPFIYHDMQKQLFIYSMPEKLFKKDEMVRDAVRENAQHTWREFSEDRSEEEAEYLRSPRVVYGLRALLEEVLIADGFTREEVRQDWAHEFIRRLFSSKSAQEIVSLLRGNIYLIDEVFFQALHAIEANAEKNAESEVAEICQAIEAEAKRIVDEDHRLIVGS